MRPSTVLRMEVKTAVYTLKLLSLSINESQLRWDLARFLSEMLRDARWKEVS